MISRRIFGSILAGLGIVEAQSPPKLTRGSPEVIVKRKADPANGECPVCGTMAPPNRSIRFCGGPKDKKESWPGNTLTACFPEDPSYISLIRCSQCNVAFYQDGEYIK